MFGLSFKKVTPRTGAQDLSSDLNIRVFLVGPFNEPLYLGVISHDIGYWR